MKYILLFLLLSTSVFARHERNFGRSPRGLLMGDAFTALADSQYSLFYNPALLARHKGFSFYPLNIAVSGTNILSTNVNTDDLNTENPEGVTDALLGVPLHVGFNYSPGFKFGRFGFSVINNSQTNLNLQNKISPTLDVEHRYDRGFIAGYAHPLFGHYSTGGVGEQLSIGASLKFIDRESIDDSFYLYGTSSLDALDSSDIADILSSLGQTRGEGYGVDLGFDYVKSTSTNKYSLGLAILDIGTNFNTDKNPDNLKVQTQPARINLGAAWHKKLSTGFDFKMSADIRQLQNSDVEFLRRLHLGAELGLTPALSLLVGLNAKDNYSYGMKLNLGLIKVFAGFFTTEIGERVGQVESERFTIFLSLLELNFNP